MKKDPNNIFIDTNILIGASAGVTKDSECIHYLLSLNGKRLFISSLSVAQYVSVFQKTMENEELKKKTRALLNRFNVLSFAKEDIEDSLKENCADIEDSIQHVISKKMNCAFFVTNNVKDYRMFVDITVVSPTKIRSIRR